MIPTLKDQRRRLRFDGGARRERNVVKRCVGRLKEHRCVATHYEKLAKRYLATLTLAASLMDMKTEPSHEHPRHRNLRL